MVFCIDKSLFYQAVDNWWAPRMVSVMRPVVDQILSGLKALFSAGVFISIFISTLHPKKTTKFVEHLWNIKFYRRLFLFSCLASLIITAPIIHPVGSLFKSFIKAVAQNLAKTRFRSMAGPLPKLCRFSKPHVDGIAIFTAMVPYLYSAVYFA